MFRDYAWLSVFEFVPKLMADVEPALYELDRLLDVGIFQHVKATLRLLVVKRLYEWSYADTEHIVADSLVLRQFCRLYLQPVLTTPPYSAERT